MDQLGAIKLFNRVVETGSFSEAGRQTNLAPSSVSRRIIELETWIGASLFNRTTRKLHLTEAGQFFNERTKSLLLDLEEIRILSAERLDKPAGLLRISIPASLEQHMVIATSQFQNHWPAVSFNLTSTERNVDLIAEGFDIAIRAGNLTDSTLRARKIAEVKRYLVASPHYLNNAAQLRHPLDIENHCCLNLRRNPGYNIWSFNDNDGDISNVIDVRASGEFNANSGNMLVTAARHGRGLMLAPMWVIGPAIAQRGLIKLLPDYTPYPATSCLYAVHPYQRFIPPKVSIFIDFLVKHFSSTYDWSINPSDIKPED